MRGQFFDIKPSNKGKNPPKLGHRNGFFTFAVVALIAFLTLSLSNAYTLGQEMVFESQELAYEGYGNIKLGMENLLAKNTGEAKSHFLEAETAFHKLDESTGLITSQKNHLLAETMYLDTADKLIEGALEVTQIGQELADLMQSFAELPQAALLVAGGEDAGLIEALEERKKAFDEIMSLAASLQRKITTINEQVLPKELREKVVSARIQVGQVIAALLEVDRDYETLLDLLGDRVPHRYLILLQNNHELRATGGFIGSYMIVDVNDGQLAKLEAKDVYETDGQLKEVIEPPPGIDLVADRLYMRDANYSPDFPTSAQSIMWFLEHSKGPSVDTVIAVDQSVVEKLLEVTGPLVLPSFPFQIRADNFSDIISFYTEAKLSKAATPKQLLFDLIPVLQKKFTDLRDIDDLLTVGLELVNQKHIQAYSVNPDIQRLIVRAGLDGAVPKPEKDTDYLSVITTAVGGNKSDQYIKTDLHHRAEVNGKGEVLDELRIKKTHTWGHRAESKLANLIERYGTGKLSEEAAYFILGRGPNLDYTRVYVPKGSKLQSVAGVSIDDINVTEELGYTVFGFLNGPINAGESKEVILHYTLPFRLSSNSEEDYQLVTEKQAGAENVTLKEELITQEAMVVTN